MPRAVDAGEERRLSLQPARAAGCMINQPHWEQRAGRGGLCQRRSGAGCAQPPYMTRPLVCGTLWRGPGGPAFRPTASLRRLSNHAANHRGTRSGAWHGGEGAELLRLAYSMPAPRGGRGQPRRKARAEGPRKELGGGAAPKFDCSPGLLCHTAPPGGTASNIPTCHTGAPRSTAKSQ